MIKKIWKENRKKLVMMIIICLVIITMLAGGIVYVLFFGGSQEDASQTQTPSTGAQQEVVSASGTTMVGIVEDQYDIDYLDEDLYIEEVYISSGDQIEESQEILKFSEDSINEAREQLEEELTTATLDYQSGEIEYTQSVLEAKKTYQLNLKNGELAQSAYDDSISKIDTDIALLQKELTEKQETLLEYQEAVNNDTYYQEYEVAEKEARFKTVYA